MVSLDINPTLSLDLVLVLVLQIIYVISLIILGRQRQKPPPNFPIRKKAICYYGL